MDFKNAYFMHLQFGDLVWTSLGGSCGLDGVTHHSVGSLTPLAQPAVSWVDCVTVVQKFSFAPLVFQTSASSIGHVLMA